MRAGSRYHRRRRATRSGEPPPGQQELPGAVPVASFTVVMATGIVAVAARDNGQTLLATGARGAGGRGLALIIGWLAVAWIRIGCGIGCGRHPVDRTCRLFGSVAATDVVAAQFDPMDSAPRMVLLAAALTAWVVVMGRLVTVLHATGLAALRTGARGSWLLVVVATQSLVLIAVRPVTTGTASTLFVALLVATVAVWTASLLGYLVITAAVVGRLLGTRLAPALLTPDLWILMGAQAITVVAGATLIDDLDATSVSGPLHGPAVSLIAVCWLVATAWIPLLAAAEARRARTQRPGFEPLRWATVFPLGMYAVTCATLATIAPTAQTALHEASTAMFWVALAAWCATAVSMITHITRSTRRARRPNREHPAPDPPAARNGVQMPTVHTQSPSGAPQPAGAPRWRCRAQRLRHHPRRGRRMDPVRAVLPPPWRGWAVRGGRRTATSWPTVTISGCGAVRTGAVFLRQRYMLTARVVAVVVVACAGARAGRGPGHPAARSCGQVGADHRVEPDRAWQPHMRLDPKDHLHRRPVGRVDVSHAS